MENQMAQRARQLLRQGRGLAVLLLLAAVLGALAGLLDAVFGQGILSVTAFREAYPLLMLLLPVAGLLIVFVYARWGGDCGRGMALVFDTAAGKRERPPRR